MICGCRRPTSVAIICCLCERSLSPNTNIVLEHTQEVITEYEQRLRRTPFAPRLSYWRRMLAEDGGANKMFFTVLFCDEGGMVGPDITHHVDTAIPCTIVIIFTVGVGVSFFLIAWHYSSCPHYNSVHNSDHHYVRGWCRFLFLIAWNYSSCPFHSY